MRSFRRQRTRRDELLRRANDVVGRVCWSATRWYGRQVKAQAPPHLIRSSVVVGAAFTAVLGGITLRKRYRPSPAPGA